ncbi:hypothetical protein [Falsiroseomonas sp. HW251]|uniref:hypothetical protein n=1 Tax=Falsiroseomonas sp. HW251 TaxID=3390998 RepID=UPI003D31AFAA
MSEVDPAEDFRLSFKPIEYSTDGTNARVMMTCTPLREAILAALVVVRDASAENVAALSAKLDALNDPSNLATEGQMEAAHEQHRDNVDIEGPFISPVDEEDGGGYWINGWVWVEADEDEECDEESEDD